MYVYAYFNIQSHANTQRTGTVNYFGFVTVIVYIISGQPAARHG